MTNPIIPLCRSIDTDRLYRSNTGSAKLLRCLMKSYNTLNLGCFVPQLPIWTEGDSYAVGDIIFGRAEILPDYVYCLHIWECRVAHTATQNDRPVDQTTLKWRKIGSTPTNIEYPPCSILSNGDPYGGLNKSPTGILVSVSGIQPQDSHYQTIENAWHHDYNGIYCLPLGEMYWATGTAWTIGGPMNGDLEWRLEFQVTAGHGHCGEGLRRFTVRQQKRTITDNWWRWNYLFCGSKQIEECEASYVLTNQFPQKPYPAPVIGSEQYNAWLESIRPARTCCCPEYESYQWPEFNGWGGQLALVGFTDYLSVGYDTRQLTYDGNTAHCRWRFALWGSVNGVNTKRAILKDNIACDFFRYDFLGSDWGVFQGCTTIPLSPDPDGFFEYTVNCPAGSTVSDFGITNINAYNWKYKSATDMLGTVGST